MPGNDDFERLRVIGKGSYGEVWLAKHKKDKKQYVLKKMNLGKASKRERKSAEQEAKLLSKLKHPNIVSYKDSFETDSRFLYIAMQYCEGGDLYAKLKEQRGNALEERQVVEWFVQIAMALQYMHERNILHRDLKTQNIFLTKSKIIKVGDLGIARVLDNASDMATTLIGTPYYMSPELFSNKPYNHKSDVWALGCCVYEMTTLKHAFNAKDMNSLVYKILKGRMPPMPEKYSADLLTLMRSMLHQDPEKRPSVNRILRDQYIKKNIAIFLEDTKKSSSRRPSTASSASRPSSAGVAARRLPSTPASPVAPPERIARNVPQEMPRGKPRDELDSPKKPMAAEASPAMKPPQCHKVSEQSVSGKVESVQEKSELPLKSSSSDTGGDSGETQETLTPQQPQSGQQPREQAKSPKRESAPRKKNFLRNHLRKSDDSDKEIVNKNNNHSRPSSGPDKKSSQSSVAPHKPRLIKREDRSRPVPLPRAEESSGLPQRREDRMSPDEISRLSPESSKSSSVSSSKDSGDALDGETPRSLPNLSARQRRRQQKSDTAASMDNAQAARIRLRPQTPQKSGLPQRTGSEKITRAEKALPPRLVRPQKPRNARQPSLNDSSSSSSDESQKISEIEKEDTQEKEIKRENKEMNNFISLLDTTLKMNNAAEESDEGEELQPVEEEPSPPPAAPAPPEPQIHKSVSMPSVETLTNTSRLMDRIRMLHKDCIQGVGYSVLKKAYEILDKIDEDEVEPQLVDLLGMDKFDEYAGKIWQLKFCEEALFLT